MLLVLASAVLHALWNALLKRAHDQESMSLGILAISLLAPAGLLPWIHGPLFPVPAALAWAVAAGVGEGCYFLALARTLRNAPLGWSYAWMRGLALVLVWPVSLLGLGETLRPLAAGSVGVVCLGLACMGLVAGRGHGRRGIAWAVATAGCIAVYTLCYKVSLRHGANPVALFATSMLVALPIQVGMRLQHQGRAALRRPGQPLPTLLAGTLCAASFLLYLKALSLEGAGVMTTLRNTSIVFTLVLSWAMGEAPAARQWAGALLVAAGAAGLAWP
jgi:drug/metabolite transporter (DMT)-like permease